MMAKQPKSTETQEGNKRGNAIREEEKKKSGEKLQTVKPYVAYMSHERNRKSKYVLSAFDAWEMFVRIA